jgi:hypothetical protein
MQYKYLGLLAIIILVFGLLLVVIKWPADKNKTFSQHVAPYRYATIYYSLLFIVTLPVLLIFFIEWFTPYFDMTAWFNFFVVVAAALQIACTFAPETGGWKTSWHRALAGCSAIFLLPPLVLLLLQPTINIPSKLLATASLAVMTGCIYTVAKSKGNPRNFLYIQCVYFSAFLLPIIAVSYF